MFKDKEILDKLGSLKTQVYKVIVEDKKEAEGYQNRLLLLQTENERLRALLDERDHEIQELKEKLEQDVDDAYESLNKLISTEKDAEQAKNELEIYKNLAERALKLNKDKDEYLWELSSAFALITEGLFRQDVVEFAALKTYRGGWQYIFHDGKSVEDLGKLKRMECLWNRDTILTLETEVEREA